MRKSFELYVDLLLSYPRRMCLEVLKLIYIVGEYGSVV